MERRRRLRATNTQEHYIYCEQGKEFFSQKQKGSLPFDGTHAKAKRVEQSTKNSYSPKPILVVGGQKATVGKTSLFASSSFIISPDYYAGKERMRDAKEKRGD